jgi:UDP-hydrolysing UDP-N-acetyl-D-glucosamine 2-epimerase
MKEIENDPDLDLQLIVTGTHLSASFGETIKVIESDGFTINERVDIEIGDDSPVGVSRSLGLAVIGVGKALDRLKPDIVIVLGDRFEILGAAEAAMIARIPIAHIHGGEVTVGAMDDSMRHAVTKFASLHFVAAEEYRTRVIQLGEEHERVFTVGAPGLDSIKKLDFMSRAELKMDLRLPSDCLYFLVTYHPETLGDRDPSDEAREMLAALDQFPKICVVLTGVNADPGHSEIARVSANYAENHKQRVFLFQSLGQLRYLSAMKYAAAVIGNSSSGIIEAPAIGVPTINIGTRQSGRLRASSIIDCIGNSEAIVSAIEQALNPSFRKGMKNMTVPYGSGGASYSIKHELKHIDLKGLTRKSFKDVKFETVVS